LPSNESPKPKSAAMAKCRDFAALAKVADCYSSVSIKLHTFTEWDLNFKTTRMVLSSIQVIQMKMMILVDVQTRASGNSDLEIYQATKRALRALPSASVRFKYFLRRFS